jgi:hypothetical protein
MTTELPIGGAQIQFLNIVNANTQQEELIKISEINRIRNVADNPDKGAIIILSNNNQIPVRENISDLIDIFNLG